MSRQADETGAQGSKAVGLPLALIGSNTVIRLDEGALATLRAETQNFVDILEKSTGIALPVLNCGDPGLGGLNIHIGRSEYLDALDLGLESLDRDGFVLRGVDTNNLVIAGRTSTGTVFGLYEFLERYLGVRWLMPGEYGVHLPQQPEVAIPLEEIRREPAYDSRLLSGLLHKDHKIWAKRNRLVSRISFHHNLHRIISVEKYAKKHPEFFPIHNGKRYIPLEKHQHGWQPCFSSVGSAQAAANTILDTLSSNPSLTTVSLGVNDRSGHCECTECRLNESSNSLGLRNLSNLYYAWCNRVVELVSLHHPEILIGCLAYSEVSAPPEFDLHPNLFPFITYDRHKWLNKTLEQHGFSDGEKWSKVSENIGWYDYLYGAPYCAPRIYFHHMAEYLKWGSEHGVKAYYAEAYGNWGEGPKLYLALKLLWDPNLSVDALLADWYRAAVGEKSSGYLAEYYSFWEKYWTERVPELDWFSSSSGQYLPFSSPKYLSEISLEEVGYCRSLLEKVLLHAASAVQKRRAEAILHAFEYYEASILSFNALDYVLGMPLESEGEVLEVLALASNCIQKGELREAWRDEIIHNYPEMEHSIKYSRYPSLIGKDWTDGLLGGSLSWLERSDRVLDQVKKMSQSDVKELRKQAEDLLGLVPIKDRQNLLKNGSLEEGGSFPSSWSTWVRGGIGRNVSTLDSAKTGLKGIKAEGVSRGGIHQDANLPAGRYLADAYVKLADAYSSEIRVSIAIVARDRKGGNLDVHTTTVLAESNDWIRIGVGGEVAGKYDGKDTHAIRLIVYVDGLTSSQSLLIDDLGLYSY